MVGLWSHWIPARPSTLDPVPVPYECYTQTLAAFPFSRRGGSTFGHPPPAKLTNPVH